MPRAIGAHGVRVQDSADLHGTLLFFFSSRRRHTRSLRDWSSVVCSSDLSAVPPEKLGGYLRDLRKLLTEFGYASALYGHFGQGCVHTRIDFDLVTRAGIEKYRRFMDEAADLVLSYGGSLSGEHGDGQSRAELLPKMFGAELIEAFNEFKSIWDPDWKMNPG